MTKCYFENLQNITFEQLLKAKNNVIIAVAWINFLEYKPIFCQLIEKKVKIKIIINDDNNNQRYVDEIAKLRNSGIKIKCVKIIGIMHHKFCIVDESVCLWGSFNWTINANEKNSEDITVTDEKNVINEYMIQFKSLWELSEQDIRLLRKPQKCKECNSEKINICFFEQEGDYQTKMSIVKVCCCGEKNIAEKYFDISVYNNIISIYDTYRDKLEEVYQTGDEEEYQDVLDEMEYCLSKHLSNVRKHRLGCDIIHAVGVRDWRWFNKHDGEWYYRIIWKEKYTSTYVQDEYDIIDW